MHPPGRCSLSTHYGLSPEQEGVHLVLQLRKNNIEIDVKVKCIEAETTQAKLAAAIDSTPPCVSKKNGTLVLICDNTLVHEIIYALSAKINILYYNRI